MSPPTSRSASCPPWDPSRGATAHEARTQPRRATVSTRRGEGATPTEATHRRAPHRGLHTTECAHEQPHEYAGDLHALVADFPDPPPEQAKRLLALHEPVGGLDDMTLIRCPPGWELTRMPGWPVGTEYILR